MSLYPLRQEELKRLKTLLRDQSVLLIGPRRIGKTSLLKQLAEDLDSSFRAVYVDLEAMRDPASAVDRITQSLREAGVLPKPSVVRGQLDRVAEVDAQVMGVGLGLKRAGDATLQPMQALEAVLGEALASLPNEQRLVLLLDEVPWWLDAIRETGTALDVRTTLASLRALRQGPLGERLRFVLTGSVGLDPLAKACDATRELNDLRRHLLDPLGKVSGLTCFEMLLEGAPFKPEAAAHAWWLAGGSPHWIERLVSNLPAGPIDRAAVETAANALLRPALRKELEDQARDDFLRRYAPDQAARFSTVLAAVAADERGLPFDGVIATVLAASPGLSRKACEELIWTLQDGWLLVVQEREGVPESVRFQSPLHARWWQRYGGTP